MSGPNHKNQECRNPEDKDDQLSQHTVGNIQKENLNEETSPAFEDDFSCKEEIFLPKTLDK